MTTTSRLYYEAHITVEGGAEAEWPAFVASANAHAWRASKFEVDEVDHYDGAWFLSFRSEKLDIIARAVDSMVIDLATSNYTVRRWKIEDTLFDSKHGDILETLRGVR